MKGIYIVKLAKNGIPVSVKLRTKISQDNHHQSFLHESMGQAVRVGENWYIRYEENGEDQQPITVMIKLTSEGSIHLTRNGIQKTKLIFHPKLVTQSNYQTPYGIMVLTNQTHQLSVHFAENPLSGKVDIYYELFSGEENSIGKYQLHLEFKEI